MIDHDRYLAIPDLFARAVAFATDMHGAIDHRRKYTNVPYIQHPLAVADIVRRRPHTLAMLVAAVLHDTVEDTFATISDIAYLFGIEVAQIVSDLTDVAYPWLGNRTARKAMDRAHTAAARPDSKTVKCADCLENGWDIATHDVNFAVVYLREIASLAAGPLEGADPVLLEEVRTMIRREQPRVEAFAAERRIARKTNPLSHATRATL